MDASELELFVMQDFIDELVRRTTFQGVVVRTIDGAKHRHWAGERPFAVRPNANFRAEEEGRLHDVISRQVARRE